MPLCTLACFAGCACLLNRLPIAEQVWTLSGECVAELVGHTALVYCAACTFDGLVASGSEDNTAKLWHADGTCLQV